MACTGDNCASVSAADAILGIAERSEAPHPSPSRVIAIFVEMAVKGVVMCLSDDGWNGVNHKSVGVIPRIETMEKINAVGGQDDAKGKRFRLHEFCSPRER